MTWGVPAAHARSLAALISTHSANQLRKTSAEEAEAYSVIIRALH